MKYKIFKYTGNIETFIPKTSTINVFAFGARGSYGNLGGGIPGKGGMVKATLKVQKNIPLYIKVGGISKEYAGCNIKKGGESTEIRLKKNDIHSRILVAGGGGSVGGYNGGSYGNNPKPKGGSGGGKKAGSSSGGGGGQNNGGIAEKYLSKCKGKNGKFKYGGVGDNICGCNGSGGGGWYGGASGTNEGGGGGGSSYVIPGSLNIKHIKGINDDDGVLIIFY